MGSGASDLRGSGCCLGGVVTVRESDFSAPRPKVCLVHEDVHRNDCTVLNFYSVDEAVDWLERNLQFVRDHG